QPRQAEIHHARFKIGSECDVCWFEITMQHALLMGVVDGFRDFLQTFGGPSRRQRIFSKGFCECSAGHVFHGQKWLTSNFTSLVQNYDVWMMQSRHSLNLAQKTMPFIIRSVPTDHFERHPPIQPDVPSFEDLTHRAVPQRLEQLI